MCQFGESCVKSKIDVEDIPADCLVVMPVRYAIAHEYPRAYPDGRTAGQRAAPGAHRPAPRIRQPFDVQEPGDVQGPGSTETLLRNARADYTVRHLRSGYLHLYEEESARWTHFRIYDKYYSLATPFEEVTLAGEPLTEKGYSDNPKEKQTRITQAGYYLVIPSAPQTKVIWFGFSDYPWTPATLKKNEVPANRKLHMQSLDVQAALQVSSKQPSISSERPHVARMDNIGSIVSEHDESFVTAEGAAPRESFNFSPFNFKSYHHKNDELLDKLDHRNCKGGVILALHDPVGIVCELTSLMFDKAQRFDKKHRLEVFTNAQITSIRNSFFTRAKKEREAARHEKEMNPTGPWTHPTLLDPSKRQPPGIPVENDPMVEFVNNLDDAEYVEKLGNVRWDKFHKSEKGDPRYNETARADWQDKYENAKRELDKQIMSLAQVHAAWMKSSQCVNYFRYNYDPTELKSGLDYLNTIVGCTAGTQDKKPCYDLYKNWLMSNDDSNQNPLMRALILNQDKISEWITSRLSPAATEEGTKKDPNERGPVNLSQLPWALTSDPKGKGSKNTGNAGAVPPTAPAAPPTTTAAPAPAPPTTTAAPAPAPTTATPATPKAVGEYTNFILTPNVSTAISSLLWSVSGPISDGMQTWAALETRRVAGFMRTVASLNVLTEADGYRSRVIRFTGTQVGLAHHIMGILRELALAGNKAAAEITITAVKKSIAKYPVKDIKTGGVYSLVLWEPGLTVDARHPTSALDSLHNLSQGEFIAAYDKVYTPTTTATSAPTPTTTAPTPTPTTTTTAPTPTPTTTAPTPTPTTTAPVPAPAPAPTAPVKAFTSVVLAIVQMVAIKTYGQDMFRARYQDQTEAEWRFYAAVLTGAGAVMEAGNRVTAFQQGSAGAKKFFHSKAIMTLARYFGVVGGFIMGLFDLMKVSDNIKRGNKTTAFLFLASGLLGWVLAGAAFMNFLTGPIGWIAIGLAIALAFWAAWSEDSKLQKWLEHCCWGNTPDIDSRREKLIHRDFEEAKKEIEAAYA